MLLTNKEELTGDSSPLRSIYEITEFSILRAVRKEQQCTDPALPGFSWFREVVSGIPQEAALKGRDFRTTCFKHKIQENKQI